MDRLAQVTAGFAPIDAEPVQKAKAAEYLSTWLTQPEFAAYRPQLEALIDAGKWSVLLDSYYQIMPFGTGGRRGSVGVGPNRMNLWTLGASVQGHCDYLKQRFPGESRLQVVLAYDVRVFRDTRGVYDAAKPNPVLNLTSRNFCEFAAGVYAANGVHAHLLPEGVKRYTPTPELSFSIRHLKAHGGLNMTASHNPPDDNGSKFYDERGAQPVPPEDQIMSDFVDQVVQIKSLPWPDALKSGRVHSLDQSVHEAYIDLCRKQSLLAPPKADELRVVYTPLQGVGNFCAGEVLERQGFRPIPVPEQAEPDGSFSHVTKAPNPEVPESLDRAEAVARVKQADLVIATDPDADRIGGLACTSPDGKGEYRFLTGQELAALLTHFKLSRLATAGDLPASPIVITTEVTTGQITRIARHFNAQVIADLLVGFKYPADVLKHLETTGHYGDVQGTTADFVIATEESHGVLCTADLRDKDSACAALLMAEMALHQKRQGRTIPEYLDDLARQFGHFHNDPRQHHPPGRRGQARHGPDARQAAAEPAEGDRRPAGDGHRGLAGRERPARRVQGRHRQGLAQLPDLPPDRPRRHPGESLSPPQRHRAEGEGLHRSELPADDSRHARSRLAGDPRPRPRANEDDQGRLHRHGEAVTAVLSVGSALLPAGVDCELGPAGVPTPLEIQDLPTFAVMVTFRTLQHPTHWRVGVCVMTDVKEATAALAMPFEPGEVKFKPQAVKGNRAMAVAYVDCRMVQDRLDEVLGVENWQDDYDLLPDGSVVLQAATEDRRNLDHEGRCRQPERAARRRRPAQSGVQRRLEARGREVRHRPLPVPPADAMGRLRPGQATVHLDADAPRLRPPDAANGCEAGSEGREGRQDGDARLRRGVAPPAAGVRRQARVPEALYCRGAADPRRPGGGEGRLRRRHLPVERPGHPVRGRGGQALRVPPSRSRHRRVTTRAQVVQAAAFPGVTASDPPSASPGCAMIRLTTILLVLASCPTAAHAGWLTVKNDTDRTVVLESSSDCVLAKRTRSVRLLPGEVYREFRLVPGERKVQILDGSQPAQPLGQGTLAWKLGDQTLHVEAKPKAEWTLAEPVGTVAKAEVVNKSR